MLFQINTGRFLAIPVLGLIPRRFVLAKNAKQRPGRTEHVSISKHIEGIYSRLSMIKSPD